MNRRDFIKWLAALPFGIGALFGGKGEDLTGQVEPLDKYIGQYDFVFPESDEPWGTVEHIFTVDSDGNILSLKNGETLALPDITIIET